YDLNAEGICPCQGCNYCRTHDGCAVQDPLQPAYKEIHQAEAIILGTPIYFRGVTAQTKIWIDRMFSMIESKDGGFAPRHPGKQTITVYSQGYYDAAAYQNAIDSTNGILKGFGWNIIGTLLCYNTSSPTFVLPPELLKRAFDVGQSLAKLSHH
ncbi:MAG: flavodoxin family protein, partial [Planctomycetaceae bacterium]|nr:flavodoxin family protein [Planctomycetaceae bacterium]